MLDFYSRVEVASVKNFQLIEKFDEGQRMLLQFGKVNEKTFNLDFTYPISPVQAFAIAISSCDNKLLCQ